MPLTARRLFRTARVSAFNGPPKKPRQDFLDTFAELTRLTSRYISTQVWHGSSVKIQEIQCSVLHGGPRYSESA